MSFTIDLNGGAPWGFGITGGVDKNQPVVVSKVSFRNKVSSKIFFAIDAKLGFALLSWFSLFAPIRFGSRFSDLVRTFAKSQCWDYVPT